MVAILLFTGVLQEIFTIIFKETLPQAQNCMWNLKRDTSLQSLVIYESYKAE